MPRLIELISRVTLGPLVKVSPELKALVDHQAKAALKEAEALAKAEGKPLGYAVSATQLPPLKYSRTESKPGTGVTFAALRDLSTYYWCARACINKRQEQIHNLEWQIVNADPENYGKVDEAQIRAIKDFFRRIGGPNRSFRQFLDMVIDDLLTIDGAAIYRVVLNNGNLDHLWPLDSATIRVRVDETGRLPVPPEAAYQQWVRGKLVAEMTTEEMDYLMMNARTNTPYGLAPLESLVLIVNAALKSEVSNLAILGEGNIPEGLIAVPPEWSTDQIKQFQEYWDAMLAGNFAQQRRVKFIPGGAQQPFIATKKPTDMEFGEMEKWLAIKTCSMFGVSPQSLGMTFDINKATAAEQSNLAKNESIRPLAASLEEYFDRIIQEDLGFKDLRFSFLGFDARDERSDAEVFTKYISSGVLSVNEVRGKIGEDPVEEGDELFVLTAAGPVPLGQVDAEPDEDANEPKEEPAPNEELKQEPPKAEEKMEQSSPVDELKRWRKVALHDLSAERAFRKFQSDALDIATLHAIDQELQPCTTPAEIRTVFRKYLASENDKLIDAAGVMLDELTNILRRDGPKPLVEIKR